MRTLVVFKLELCSLKRFCCPSRAQALLSDTAQFVDVVVGHVDVVLWMTFRFEVCACSLHNTVFSVFVFQPWFVGSPLVMDSTFNRASSAMSTQGTVVILQSIRCF